MEYKPESVQPVECKIWVKVDTVDESVGTIIKPEDTQEREQLAQDMGILVAAGGMAFSDWTGRIPEVGERIVFDKYQGRLFRFRNEDRSQTQYRLVNDVAVSAIIDPQEEDDAG